MKPTIKVSIGRIAFNLEENAYRLLKQYLDRLQAHYEKFNGGKEIVDDIELRITELLRERINSPEQAISETIIKEIIAILGQPEEIEADDELSGNEFAETNKKTVRKKLYRDIDNKLLGGVCSGLATYFNIDVVLVRVLFVVFFIGFSAFHFSLLRTTGGTTALVYVLLWIITPPARTLQQRYEMHGKTPNITNIQRKVEKELREAKQAIQKSTPVIGEIFRAIGKVCLIFIGLCLIFVAVIGLIAFIVAFASGHAAVGIFCSELMNYVAVNWRPWWFFGLLAALLFLPFIGMLYGGIKLLFRIKTKVKIGLIIFLLWITVLFVTVGVSVFSTKPFFHWRTIHEYVELPAIHSDTLYVDIPQEYYTAGIFEPVVDRINSWSFRHHRRHDYYRYKGHSSMSLFFFKENRKTAEKLLLLPTVDVRHSGSEQNFGVDISKSAAGNNIQNAYIHARQLPFNYTIKDSLLIVEPLRYTKDSRWDGELLRLRFQVPEGKKIVFGEAFRDK